MSNSRPQRLQSSQVFCPTGQKIAFSKESGIPDEWVNIPDVGEKKTLKTKIIYVLRNKIHRGDVQIVSDWEKMAECSLCVKNGKKMITGSRVKYRNTDNFKKKGFESTV